MICSAIIGIFYFLIYKNERRASNRYYLSTLSIWGILAISTPFILFATRLVLALSKSELVTDNFCLLYTSDAADDTPCVYLGGRRINKKKFFQAEDGIRDAA